MPTPLGSIVYTGLNKMGLNQASNFTELDENSGDNSKKIISKKLVSKDKMKFGAQINISSKESIFQSSSILSNADLKRSDQIITKKKKLKP